MRKKNYLYLLGLVPALTAAFWTVEPNLWPTAAATQPTVSDVSQTSGAMRKTTQAQRQSVRTKQAKQKLGVTKSFAGVNPSTAQFSPLATVGQGPTAAAAMASPFGPPDYFGVPNWANSPLPTVNTATGAVTGGMRKFVDTLPDLKAVIATPDTTTFPNSDYYEISLVEYNQVMHSDLAAANGGLGTKLRGYVQTHNGVWVGTPSYLGPVIVATKNRPVRVKFTNALPTGAGGNLFIPTDTTYMGAGTAPDGTNYTQNRATLHLHGGLNPWISDGTPHTWITPAGEATTNPTGASQQNVPDMWWDPVTHAHVAAGTAGATNDPGPGSATFYWSNQESGRLMFYHDHAYGITRLNVYVGEAAGYIINDPVEEDALATATVPGTLGTTPDKAHLIPLVIQDKTFVPDNGVAGGQLAATDPTWPSPANPLNGVGYGFGDLWFPHVYMPNQNPYAPDLSGANALGRWDYGPWFWPPMNPSTLVGLPAPCQSAAFPGTTVVCPGTPNPSGTPEAFMDTPVINGKAYPKLSVAPAAYRFRILNAANDRTFNLGLYVAEPLSLGLANPGAGYTAPPAVTITPSNGFSATAVLSYGEVTAVSLVGGGTGYTTVPNVVITGDGTGATATAAVTAGTVTSITVTNPGRGYTKATVAVDPSPLGCATAGNCATATATIAATGTLVGITVTPPAAPITPFTTVPTVSVAAPGCAPGAACIPAVAIASINTEVKMLPASLPTATSALPACTQLTPVTTPGLGLGLATSAIYDGVTNITGLPTNCWPVYSNDPGLPTPAMWPTDGRSGGVPDPTTAGPPIIQIGSESGVLPSPAVIPSTPLGYEYNRRSITVTNISTHGLLMGPAERSDVVVDFTKFAGKTLILYNDAPAPVPAFDARTDYFTGDPDQTPTGGAPSTIPGYGPNTRTIMQIYVDPTVSNPNVTAFSPASLQTALPTVFTASQPAHTVPDGVYSTIQATSLTLSNASVTGLNLTAAGSGYLSAPTVTFVGNGTGAAATATVAGSALKSVTIVNKGLGYTNGTRNLVFTGGNPTTAAVGKATIAGGVVTAVTITNLGAGYTSDPVVTLSGAAPKGTGATVATFKATRVGSAVTGITLTAGGSNYTAPPSVFITGGGGTGALADAVLDPTKSFQMEPKTIQELFTLDYGRMNATLGVELPFTNFMTQTTLPMAYIDPPTELIQPGVTQVWKITHNGVDTHFIHFHLFDVQLINRVGWDGAIKPPDLNEIGYKDTVRMNPLEDVIVALRPKMMTKIASTDLDPATIPNSVRPLDVSQPLGTTLQFTGIDPNGNPAPVLNEMTNFGWEYVWHCHILGHEENDMMRAVALAIPPVAPGKPILKLIGTGTSQVSVTWVAGSTTNPTQTGFTIMRATVVGGVTGPYAVVGTTDAATKTFTDTGLARKTMYSYQVIANNVVGYNATPGYPTLSADSAASVATTITTK